MGVGRDGLGRIDIRSLKMKKRNRRCDPQKQRHWEVVMRRWREGGQAVRAFCRAEGVRESAFYFWRQELARRGHGVDAKNGLRPEGGPVTQVSRSSARISSRRSPTPSFLPVHVVEPRVNEADRGVEIFLAEGRTVRVQAGFDRQTLADVLAVLEVQPC
jgi:transposase-like protein